MNKVWYILLFVVSVVCSCSDDDTFSASAINKLTMDQDTVSFDTVFSRVPTSAKYFWVRNNSADGIRCSNVRVERGNQSGFRVNVDGVYLGPESGYKTSNVEIRKGDSIRVFVELTSPKNYIDGPQLCEDNIVFTLESGVQQRVNLNAWTWDADTVHTLVVAKDSVLSTRQRPLIVYDSIVVAENATLTIEKGSTLYFRDNAGISVHGKLLCKGDAEENITLRGYRLDNMFDYLPYDNLPGHWQGIRFHSESYDNEIDFTDIHSAFNGIVCDSADVKKTKLLLTNSIIHNCQGYGLYNVGGNVEVANCQITNTLNDCVAVYGGNVLLWHCTIGQFYPFDSNRGNALLFSNWLNDHAVPLKMIAVINSIVTGYADDVIMGTSAEDSLSVDFNYYFSHNILRTPFVEDSLRFVNNIWETPDSTVSGDKHFVKIDTELLQYDFHLDSISPARGAANPKELYPMNREGILRDPEHPDMGCY